MLFEAPESPDSDGPVCDIGSWIAFHGVTNASPLDGGGSGQTCGRLGALVVVKQIGWGKEKTQLYFLAYDYFKNTD